MAFAITLICDGPECPASLTYPRLVVGSLLRRDLEEVRALAGRDGWANLRPRGSQSFGDYCPACAEDIRAARKR